MHAAYNHDRALYLVLEVEGVVIGCGGIAPLRGGDATVCELKKMYFMPEARGKGWGKAMMEQLEQAAQERGFSTIYLETLARMESANRLYNAAGFAPLSGPMGNTGHTSCGLFYAKSVG